MCAFTNMCAHIPAHIFVNPFTRIPHAKLQGIRRVSNPSTSIDPGSHKMSFLVLIQNAGFVRDNGTNSTKEGHRGRKPVCNKLLGRNSTFVWISVCIHLVHSNIVSFIRTSTFVWISVYIHQYVFNLRVNLYIFDLWVLVHMYLVTFEIYPVFRHFLSRTVSAGTCVVNSSSEHLWSVRADRFVSILRMYARMYGHELTRIHLYTSIYGAVCCSHMCCSMLQSWLQHTAPCTTK